MANQYRVDLQARRGGQDHTPYKQRLIEARSVDLRDNCRIEDLGGGYSRITPIDPQKRWGDDPMDVIEPYRPDVLP